MDYKTNEHYVSPQIEVIPMETEGTVMTGSLQDISNGGSWGTTTPTTANRHYNAASTDDLEDLINDILTVE